VGLKPGPLYYHIGSKENLLWLILRDYTTTALSSAEQISASHDDPASELQALIKFHVHTIARHRREVFIKMCDAEALTSEHSAEPACRSSAVRSARPTALQGAFGPRSSGTTSGTSTPGGT
jgi:AcrR family transcriptional regulator